VNRGPEGLIRQTNNNNNNNNTKKKETRSETENGGSPPRAQDQSTFCIGLILSYVSVGVNVRAGTLIGLLVI
jgi:hypothetical protein